MTPIAVAVFLLTTSSNLVGRSIGMEPAPVPLRTLSTNGPILARLPRVSREDGAGGRVDEAGRHQEPKDDAVVLTSAPADARRAPGAGLR